MSGPLKYNLPWYARILLAWKILCNKPVSAPMPPPYKGSIKIIEE